MSRKTGNSLTEHISQVLHEHEEPYVLGSWERFKQKQKRQRNWRMIYTVAASILVICTFLFARSGFENMPSGEIAEEKPAVILPDSAQTETEQPLAVVENSPVPETQNDDTVIESATEEDPAPLEAPTPYMEVSDRISAVSSNSIPVYLVTGNLSGRLFSPEVVAGYNEREHKPGDVYDPADHNQQRLTGRFVKEENLRKSSKKDVEFSVAYASVMNVHESQTDLGMGGGFYTDWNFTEKLAATSGLFVTQNRLKYNSEPENQLMIGEITDEEPSVLNASDLAYIQLDLVNLEVPLSFRYSISNNLSFSAGVTSVAFLKEEYDYTYEYDQPIQVFSTNETKESELVTRVVTMTTSQTETEPSLKTMNWAAFYTFSMGYEWEIMNRHQVMIEPFLKIPARQITSRDIRYTAGGLQFRILF